jgi:hypothetical protein
VYSAGMYPSGERAQALRRAILHKRFACHACASASFIIFRDARWSKTEPPTLEVGLRCANCGTPDDVSLSLVEARRCGFDYPASS